MLHFCVVCLYAVLRLVLPLEETMGQILALQDAVLGMLTKRDNYTILTPTIPALFSRELCFQGIFSLYISLPFTQSDSLYLFVCAQCLRISSWFRIAEVKATAGQWFVFPTQTLFFFFFFCALP